MGSYWSSSEKSELIQEFEASSEPKLYKNWVKFQYVKNVLEKSEHTLSARNSLDYKE